MNVEVKFSQAKLCLNCGGVVRIRYVDGEQDGLVEFDPICEATEKNPNPIYEVHNCLSEE